MLISDLKEVVRSKLSREKNQLQRLEGHEDVVRVLNNISGRQIKPINRV